MFEWMEIKVIYKQAQEYRRTLQKACTTVPENCREQGHKTKLK